MQEKVGLSRKSSQRKHDGPVCAARVEQITQIRSENKHSWPVGLRAVQQVEVLCSMMRSDTGQDLTRKSLENQAKEFRPKSVTRSPQQITQQGHVTML